MYYLIDITFSTLGDFLTIVFDHLWVTFAFFMILWKREALYLHLFYQPITEGNGYVRMDELAKYMMVFLLLYMVVTYKENQYSDAIFFAFIGGVTAIAGIKQLKLNGNNKRTRSKEEEL